MPCLYNIGGALFLVFVCHAVHSTHLGGTHLGEPVYIIERRGLHLLNSIFFVQIPFCHQSTKKGEIVRTHLSLSVLVIDDNAFAD